jgi:hypothetical protein
MADAGPSLHRNPSGSSHFFGTTALSHYGACFCSVAAASNPPHPDDPYGLLGVIQALLNLGVLP